MINHKVNVLMTAYNAEEYIEESIRSIIDQKYKNWKLILINDKSNDGTMKILKSFKNKKIKIYNLKKHIGRTNALNFGLNKCTGKYVAIQDADDLSMPNRLSNQVKFLEKNEKYKMVGSFAIKINKSKKKIGNIILSNRKPKTNLALLFQQEFIPHSTIMFDLKYGRKYKGYPSNLKYAQDFGLILKFIKNNQLKIMNSFLSKIRVLPDSMSFRDEFKIIKIKDSLNLLMYVRENFKLNLFDILKYHFYFMKYNLKLFLSIVKII